jgi:phage repressor protein C with HTH and peptisase S24 domain
MEFENTQSLFATWLLRHVSASGATLRRTALDLGIDYTFLYKVANSHKSGYAQYRRLGYANTVRLGRHFDDVSGALRAAGFESADGKRSTAKRSKRAGAGRGSVTAAAKASLRRLSSAIREVEHILEDPLASLGAAVDLSTMAALPLGSVEASAGASDVKGDPERADGLVGDILPGNIRAIRIAGDCMEPEYRNGDVVLVRPTESVKNGEKVIAVAQDSGEVLCKQFRDDRGEGRRLEPLNPQPESRTHLGEWDYRIVGVVEGSIRIGR